MKSEARIKVLLSKVGLDCHEVGIKVVASALRDAGMEVVYLGTYQTPEKIAESAVQEDADVIGLSFHAPIYFTVVSKMLNLLKQKSAEHIPIVVGGVIPHLDIARLRNMGVKEVFIEGSKTVDIVECIKRIAKNGKGDNIKS